MPTKIDALLSSLDTPSDKTAEKVIARLCRIGPTAMPRLLEAARDLSRPRVRKWSLQALGALGDRRAAPLLVKALKDEPMTVKLHAIRGLGRMKHRPAGPTLRRLLRDPSGGIRVNAVDALATIQDKASGAAICRLLSDEQWYVRQHAAKACGELGIQAAIPKLNKLLVTEKRKAVLMAATRALANVRRKNKRR